jgi:hypothetical protein
MIGGILNIVVGLVCIAGGLSGRLALLGTKSSIPLIVIGAAVAGYGVWRIIRERRDRS